MGPFLIIIAILAVLLGVCFVAFLVLNGKYADVNDRLSKMSTDYNDLLYNNFMLCNKLDTIKQLKLIDYENNQYYDELLSTEIK